jgi:DNA-binding GntR family transcriptional regulator
MLMPKHRVAGADMKEKPGRKPRTAKPAAKASAKRNGVLDERIHRDIYNAIIDHKIPPGTALQESSLATAFGVSRTVIRKVLQRLSLEKLVEIVPNKGATVAKPTAEEAREVFEARRALERVLIERVVSTASDSGIDELATLVRLETAAAEKGQKKERVKLSGDFHRKLAQLAGNAILSDFLTDLISRTSLIIALYESPGAVPCSHTEHREIAEVLKRRDAKKAAQFMDHHLQHIEAQLELSDTPVVADFKDIFRQRGKT